MGIGIGIRHTVVNLLIGHSIIPLKNKSFGKTKIIDFQVHSYHQNYIVDLYYQNYKGFFEEKKTELIQLFPNLTYRQLGSEFTYIYKGKKFSSKAVFEQSEIQRASAGSPIFGFALYWNHLSDGEIANDSSFNGKNLQIDIKGGYAYSWIINPHWMLAEVTTVGMSFINNTHIFKIYPTVFAKTAAIYIQKKWTISYSMFINYKKLKLENSSTIQASTLSMQLSFVKNINITLRPKHR